MAATSISIITPSYNRAQFIREAIKSVIQQNYDPVEHIVIDACSTDSTLQILKEYSHIKVIREKDQGMYDAINKGIRDAKGEIIGLLNTDDLYEEEAFESVIHRFEDEPYLYAVVGGATVFVDEEGSRCTIRFNPWIEPADLWERVTIGIPVMNAWFFRRDVFEKLGGFNSTYRFAADKEFLIRYAISGLTWAPVRKTLYHYRQHIGSATITPIEGRSSERAKFRSRIFDEGLTIAGQYLNKEILPIGARKNLIRWHSDRSYRLAAMALYHHKWLIAWQAMKRGCQYRRTWPIFFLRRALSRLINLIFKIELNDGL